MFKLLKICRIFIKSLYIPQKSLYEIYKISMNFAPDKLSII